MGLRRVAALLLRKKLRASPREPQAFRMAVLNIERRAVCDEGLRSRRQQSATGQLGYGISPDRAQMLIDRYGDDAERLDAAAKGAKVNPGLR